MLAIRGLKRPGGLNRLEAVCAKVRGVVPALAGVLILGRNDHREGDKILPRLGKRVIVAVFCKARIPRIRGFHRRNGLCHGFPGLHLCPEARLVFIIPDKGDGLGISVDRFDALRAQRRGEPLGRHSEADGHPEQAVRRVLGHMVGDRRAVDAVEPVAPEGVVVDRAVGSLHRRLIGGRQAGAADDCQIGRMRTRDAVIDTLVAVRIGIAHVFVVVRDAVGVKEHDRAALHGLGDSADRGLGAGIERVGSAGGGGDAIGLLLVLIGEVSSLGGVSVPRADQVDVLCVRRAAPFCIRNGLLNAEFLVGRRRGAVCAGAERGRIALRLAVCILPEEHGVRSVVGAGAEAIISRRGDQLCNAF